jgi:hypothetical protein
VGIVKTFQLFALGYHRAGYMVGDGWRRENVRPFTKKRSNTKKRGSSLKRPVIPVKTQIVLIYLFAMWKATWELEIIAFCLTYTVLIVLRMHGNPTAMLQEN